VLHAGVRDIVILGEKSDNEIVFVVAVAIVIARRSSHAGGRGNRMVGVCLSCIQYKMAWLNERGESVSHDQRVFTRNAVRVACWRRC